MTAADLAATLLTMDEAAGSDVQPDGRAPVPLTRTRRDGTRYTRRPEVEAALARLLVAPTDELLEAAAIRHPRSANHIDAECLVHLLRHLPFDGGRLFRGLYGELMRRIDAALPRFGGERWGTSENVHAANARDRVRDAFNLKLAEDKRSPSGDLDYFEIMFADALSALRASALRKALKDDARSVPIERDPATNEVSETVERAAGGFDVGEELLSDDPIYRSRVLAAIDRLPPKQRRVIEMILQDMPLDSSDDNVMSIRKALGVAEKTVRNRRDAAIASIRSHLTRDPAHV